jgi:methylenetetrahydrofolate reductase (NADPH)
MFVSDILKAADETRFSIEVYPPKTIPNPDEPSIQNHISAIFDTVEHLMKYDPIFISVTYNPAGKTKTTSIPIAAIIKQRFKVESVAHLTCIAMPPDELQRTLNVLEYFDIQNILALRGDIPEGVSSLPQGLQFASELVEAIGDRDHPFCIGVAGYPEGHPECVAEDGGRDLQKDLMNFQTKVGNGASFGITQLFLDNTFYFDYLNRVKKAGIDIPILPGIMPVTDTVTLDIVQKLCGASVPSSMKLKINNALDDPEEVKEIGIEQAVQQCKGLMDKVPCIHFYTMDKWEPVERILDQLR